MHAYLRDVATIWDELSLTLLTFRQAQDSVIGFGRVEGRRPGERVLGSIMWVVRLRGDLIASIEVFQAAGGPSLSESQLERLQGGAPEPSRGRPRSVAGYEALVSSAPERRDGVRWGRAGSLTGAACIARRRTSRHDIPSLSSAGAPMRIALETSTA